MTTKSIFVADLQEGGRLDDLFLIKSAKLGETRIGKPYLVVTVMDRTGEISGPVWDNVETMQAVCIPGEVVRLSGTVQSYREKLQLKIDAVSKMDQQEVDMSQFIASSLRNRKEMTDELHDLMRSITNPFIKKLLNIFFKKGDWLEKFQEAPAAKGIHHAYVGGLLEHSLSVAKVADLLSKHYDGVDRSLLLAGALLHDIGKIEELAMTGGLVEYTVRGRLKGHLVIGSEMLASGAGKIPDFPEDLLAQLQHLVLSHHGRQEFGSPTVPMTVEAFILSFLDDLDAKMNITEQLRRKMDANQMAWTEYQRALERYLYLGGLAKLDAPDAGSQEDGNNRQPTLF